MMMAPDGLVDRIERAYAAAGTANLTVIRLEVSRVEYDQLGRLFSVPGGMSRLGLPATVTKPGFEPCLNWRWLPVVLTCRHPSSSINLITSRT